MLNEHCYRLCTCPLTSHILDNQSEGACEQATTQCKLDFSRGFGAGSLGAQRRQNLASSPLHTWTARSTTCARSSRLLCLVVPTMKRVYGLLIPKETPPVGVVPKAYLQKRILLQSLSKLRSSVRAGGDTLNLDINANGSLLLRAVVHASLMLWLSCLPCCNWCNVIIITATTGV
jgi:hypothetical protein